MALTDQLLGAYTFDAGSLADFYAVGPTLVNENGKSINFTVGAKIGEAFAFGTYKGSDGAARLQSTNDIFTLRKLVGDPITGKDFTVTGWLYNAAANWNTQVGILSNWANDALGPTQWLFWPVDATHLEFRINDAAGSEHHAQVAAPTVAAWHFFCLTYEASSGDFSLTIDDGTPGTANIGVLGVQFGLGYVEFGNRNNAGSTLNGALDAVTFHQRVLTAGERTSLYNAGVGFQAPFLNPPVAAFSGTPLSGTRGVLVAFTDASTNTPTSWLWDFGDGYTSTLQHPTHQFGDGSFTVTLTATNADGSDSEVKVAYVVVTAPTAREDDEAVFEEFRR